MKSVKSILQVLIGPVSICILLISTPIGYTSPPESLIKIGILYPFTGPAAYMGQRMLRGWELSLEQVDYKVEGRLIKLIVEDTKGDPSVGLTKTTKLIGQDRVHILGGVLNSSEAYAIRDIVHKREIPLIITMANAGGITRENRSPFRFDPRSQNCVKNLIICKVKKVDGGFYEFQNIPFKTVPQAQDPWWLER